MAGASRVSYETERVPFKPQTVLLLGKASAGAEVRLAMADTWKQEWSLAEPGCA
jgi:hypothetical protein